MKSHETRLQRLEVARWRRHVALMVAGTGVSVDDVLEESIRFLEMPLDQRLQAYRLCQNSRHNSEANAMSNADRAYAAAMSPINWANRS
jgi:hypothetical protein